MKHHSLNNLLKDGPSKYSVLIVFLILFIIGVSNLTDYGMPIDEKTEQNLLLSNIKEYSALLGIRMQNPAFKNVTFVSNHGDLDHGIACFYPFVPILLALKQTNPLILMYAWHYYIYFIWYMGVLALYGLSKAIFHHPWTPLIGTLLYFFTPRIYAEAHYNNKDIIFLTLIVIMLFFAIKTVRHAHTLNIFLFSFFSGLLMNCKVLGIAIWGLTGIFMLLYHIIINSKPGITYSKISGTIVKVKTVFFSELVLLFPAFVFSVMFFFLLTPAMIRNPLRYLIYSFQYTARYSRWDGTYLFHGKLLSPAATGLPCTYLLEWIMMTTPVFILVLFISSICVFIYQIVPKQLHVLNRQDQKSTLFVYKTPQKSKEREFFYILFILSFLFPTLYTVFKAERLIFYNGWRHNYYLYAYVILCTIYTLDCLLDNLDYYPTCSMYRKLLSAIMCTFCAICFFITAIDMFKHRSFEYVFFNPICRVLTDVKGFEGDYWNISEIAAIRGFSDQIEKEGKKVDISIMGYAGFGLDDLIGVNIGNVTIQSKDAIPSSEKYYVFNVSAMTERSILEEYTQVYAISPYGFDLCAVYVKNE